MYTDSDGMFAIPLLPIALVGAAVLLVVYAIYAVNPDAVPFPGNSVDGFINSINNIYKDFEAEKDKLAVLLAGLVIKNLSSLGERDWHHIVAQKDPRAALSRIMLARCNININSIDNMVSVSRPMHWVMHTNGYHASVTVLLWASYGIAGEDGVKATLAAIKIIIETASGNIG